MLKRRLIPKLQMRRSRYGAAGLVLVTTRAFSETIEIGDPVCQAKIYQDVAADELIFLDLDATVDGRGTLVDVVKSVAEEVFMPFTVGGGVRRVEDFRALLAHGADKVSVNSYAVEDPDLIRRASGMFGAQCVVLSIDFSMANGSPRVKTRNGTKDTGMDAVEWARRGEELGAGEILLTSIDRDGARKGLDLEITARVADAVGIPVIAAGGCGLASHFVDGFLTGKADAVSAGTYFCYKDENPMQCRAQIKNAGIPIRRHR